MDSYKRSHEIERQRLETTGRLKRLVRKGCRTKRAKAEAITRASVKPVAEQSGAGR